MHTGAHVAFDPTREERRIRDLTSSAEPRDLVIQVDRAFFIATEQILAARIVYRVVFAALDLTLVGPQRRRFKWTPSVNSSPRLRPILPAALGSRLTY